MASMIYHRFIALMWAFQSTQLLMWQKNASGVVLLRKSLDVIADGIIEGRKTFSNTIKYILMATSSNLAICSQQLALLFSSLFYQ